MKTVIKTTSPEFHKLLTSERENTFYNMKKQGANTLWGMWNGKASHSHPMFGSVTEFLVKHFNEA